MNCKQCKEQITACLQNYWEKEDVHTLLPGDAVNHIATCMSCKNYLEAIQIFTGEQQDRIEPPPFLTTRIKARLAERIAAQEKAGSLRSWIRVRSQKPAFRYLSLSFAGVLAFVFLTFIMIKIVSSSQPGEILVHFTLTAPEAKQVVVVGDWNEWQTNLNKLTDADGNGIWELKLKIHAGKEYRYQFLIDGQRWIPDPNSLIHIDDGFGGKDSVLQL